MGATGLGRTAHSPTWELGEVLTYNSATHTSVVRTHGGRPLQNVPQIKGTAGGFDHLPIGTTVVISWDLGFPAIIGCIDLGGTAQTAHPSPSLTGAAGLGDYDPIQTTQGTISHKPPNAPTDLMAGDWVQMGALGNHVAVLEGGVALLGSTAAHVQSLGATGTLRLIARRLQQVTDFGHLTVENDQGKTSLVLRAGANQTTQTGVDEQHWTIRLDLGATGDMLDFKIVEPEGRTLFRLHAGADGRVQLYGDGGVDLSSGPNGTGTLRQDIVGDHAQTVTGDVTHAIQGDAVYQIDGAATHTTAGALTRAVSGNATTFIGGACDTGISGDETRAIAGARLTQVQGNDTHRSDLDILHAARQTNTVEGQQVKLGSAATQPVIRGTQFQSAVMAQLNAAGSTLTLASVSAAAVLAVPPVTATTVAAALTIVINALASAAGALQAAAGAYPSTLSTKVKTE